LFEVGALTTSMQVMRNDEVLYERDQAFGGAQLTQLIVRQYGFSGRGRGQKRNGDLPEDYNRRCCAPSWTAWRRKSAAPAVLLHQHALQPRRSHHAGGRLGAAAGLTEAVTENTGACSIVNPFEGMDVGGAVRLRKMAREAPSYLTSCGLAMRRFLQ
jgi:type IV pilus assembly protein PilM